MYVKKNYTFILVLVYMSWFPLWAKKLHIYNTKCFKLWYIHKIIKSAHSLFRHISRLLDCRWINKILCALYCCSGLSTPYRQLCALDQIMKEVLHFNGAIHPHRKRWINGSNLCFLLSQLSSLPLPIYCQLTKLSEKYQASTVIIHVFEKLLLKC